MNRATRSGCSAIFASAIVLVLSMWPASAQTCHAGLDSLNFGVINLAANVAYDTSGSLHLTCSGTVGSTVRICPNIGAGSGGQAGSGDPRYMINGADQLHYNLFKDAGHTAIWGSYTGNFTSPQADITLNASGTGSAIVPIYARVYAGQGSLPAVNYQSVFDGSQSSISYAYSAAGTCSAIAATHQTALPFAVTANDAATCTIAANALNFGTIPSTQVAISASTTLSATCSSGTNYTIALDGGLSEASDPTQRHMMHGADQLTYGLYKDASHAQPWGSTTGQTVAGTGTGSAQNVTVYGLIPIQTSPPIGTYQDYVIVTITY